MRSGGSGVETTIQNQLAMYIFSILGSLVGIELMSCVLAELMPKPQGEPGSKPVHNVHFLHSQVIGWELMSCALGAWCRTCNR